MSPCTYLFVSTERRNDQGRQTWLRSLSHPIIISHNINENIYIDSSRGNRQYRGGRSLTCYGKNSTAQRNPCIFLIPLEIINDVFWIKGLNDRRVIFNKIEDADATDKQEPSGYDWSKAIAHFVSSKSLNCE